METVCILTPCVLHKYTVISAGLVWQQKELFIILGYDNKNNICIYWLMWQSEYITCICIIASSWILYKAIDRDFFWKKGVRIRKKGKDKNMESFVIISLYNITLYLHNFITIVGGHFSGKVTNNKLTENSFNFEKKTKNFITVLLCFAFFCVFKFCLFKYILEHRSTRSARKMAWLETNFHLLLTLQECSFTIPADQG